MRNRLSRDLLHALMEALAASAPKRGAFRVYFLGGATAVDRGWRLSTIDADLTADDDRVFRGLQEIKERLRLNVEFARPEDFVPALPGSEERHLFIATVGRISFYHYDPYAQLLSKLVRGFRQDLQDAERFLSDGLVDAKRFRKMVRGLSGTAFARYPNLDRKAVVEVVEGFVSHR